MENCPGGFGGDGEGFFRSLAENLGKTLGVAYAMAAELVSGKELTVRTVAVFGQGCAKENFDYSLAGTPCETVLEGRLCSYPDHVQQRFPNDRMLVEMGLESYVGIPLLDSARRAFGLLAVLDTCPMRNLSDLRLGPTERSGRTDRCHGCVAGRNRFEAG